MLLRQRAWGAAGAGRSVGAQHAAAEAGEQAGQGAGSLADQRGEVAQGSGRGLGTAHLLQRHRWCLLWDGSGRGLRT